MLPPRPGLGWKLDKDMEKVVPAEKDDEPQSVATFSPLAS